MLITLPSGQTVLGPVDPGTYVDQAATVLGTPVTSQKLERDVSAAVAFARRRPIFQGYHAVAVNAATSTFTAIPMSTELIDSNGGHADGSNTSRVYAKDTNSEDDWYLITGYVPWTTNATGVRIAGIRENGAGTVFEGMKVAAAASRQTDVMVVELLRIESGDYIELMGWQSSGGSLATLAANKVPSLTMRWALSGTGNTVANPGMPRTWTSLDEITADLAGAGQVPLNLHVRDVARWLRYPPAARLHSIGTAQTLTSGTTWQSINMVGETLDNYGGHDNSTNPSRYTVQRPGLYFVYGLAAHAEPGTGGGFRACRLLVNGTTPVYGMGAIPPLTTTGTALAVSAHLRLAAGDYVELQCVHGAGSNQAVKGGAGDHARMIVLWKSL